MHHSNFGAALPVQPDPFVNGNQESQVIPFPGYHWADVDEATIVDEAADDAPAPPAVLSSLEQAAADQAPRLLAMVASSPELAREAAEILPPLGVLNQSLGLAWDVIRVRVKEHGPAIVAAAGWRPWLQSALAAAINSESKSLRPLLQEQVDEFWGVYDATDPATLMIEEGRELLRKVGHRALAAEHQHKLRTKTDCLDFELARGENYVESLRRLKEGAGGESGGYRGKPIDATALLADTTEDIYLVQHFLAADQAMVVGGPMKTQKTSVLVDLAVSLASGRPFLGFDFFAVPAAQKVMFVSGETARRDIRSLIQRVFAAKGVTLSVGQLVVEFELPQLTSETDLRLLRQAIGRHQIRVVILDPTYLMIAGGRGKLDTNNMFEMGQLLQKAVRTCQAAGATPILCHHAGLTQTRQMALEDRRPMELTDLAHAGTAQFARQWCLLSYQTPYDVITGRCALWMTVGGSSGHGGKYLTQIDQGVPATGRRWQVSVKAGHEAEQHAAGIKRAAKQAEEAVHRDKVLAFLAEQGLIGANQTEIAKAAGVNKNAINDILVAMRRDGHVVQMRPRQGNTKPWRLWPAGSLHPAQVEQLKKGGLYETVCPPSSQGVSGGAG